MIRFFLVYVVALSIIGLSGLDTAERVIVSRSVEILRTAQ